MQNTQRAKQNTPEEQDRRKEKERKREEKELRKIAAAAGVKMTKTAPTLAPVPAPGESQSTGFKKGGWASIPSTSVNSSSTRATGWGAVGSPADSSHSPSPAPEAVSSSSSFSTMPVTSHPYDLPDQRQLHQPAPAFRTAGWSSMDGTMQSPPPPPPPLPVHDVPAMAVTNEHHLPDQGPSATSIPVSAVPGPGAVLAALEAPTPKSSKSKKAKESELRENARSGWQSFQKGGRRK